LHHTRDALYHRGHAAQARHQHAYAGFLLWQSGTVSLRTALDVLMPGLGSMAPVIEGITSVVQTVSSWIGTNLPTALQVASDLWTGTLQPALTTVYDVFNTQVIPIITNLAATVLPVLGSALQVAGGFFTNVLIPAGKLLWNAFTTLLLPVLSDVAVWLRDNVPPAVQTLADFLTKTLFPALKTVYDFANANLIPLLKVLGDVLSATVGKAVEALAALWENILWPALKKAGGWISDTLGPILKNFTSWLGDVTGGVEGITSAIQDAIKWLSDLADTISKLSLPDWLTPGSPTPWEIGLRGIGDALKTEVNPQVDSLFNTLTVAPPASAQQLQAGGGSTTTIDNSRNLTMPVYTNNSPDAIQTSAAIALAVLP
jgi:phage-related protein